MSLIMGLTPHLVKGVCFLRDPRRARQSWQGASTFDLLRAGCPGSASAEGTGAAKAGQACHYICFGRKDATKETRHSPGWPVFCVATVTLCSGLSPLLSCFCHVSPRLPWGQNLLGSLKLGLFGSLEQTLGEGPRGTVGAR